MFRALRLVAIALIGVAMPAAAAAPVTGQQAKYAITVTPDPASEAKFPKEPKTFVDALQAVNAYVNTNIQPVSDEDQYGMNDYFVQAPTSGAGDCEDYALTKLLVIENSDFDIVGRTKLVFVRIHYTSMSTGKKFEDGHAILAVLMPGGDVAYLDNLNDHLMTRHELVLQGYEFFNWG
jgi:predicted transglutaminase-like cysteine proteinase